MKWISEPSLGSRPWLFMDPTVSGMSQIPSTNRTDDDTQPDSKGLVLAHISYKLTIYPTILCCKFRKFSFLEACRFWACLSYSGHDMRIST